MAEPQLRKLWDAPDAKTTLAWRFMEAANRKYKRNMQSWDDLHAWSVEDISGFWAEVFHHFPLVHSGEYTRVVDEDARIDSVPKWFEGIKLNVAENLLFTADLQNPNKTTTDRKSDASIAATEVREGCVDIRHLTWKDLRERVGLFANALKARGVVKGDRIAALASNSIDTLAVFYATTALGAIFSSSSTDMGTKGVLDRMCQIRPKYIFVDDGVVYNGRTIDLRTKISDIEEGMRDIPELDAFISLPRWSDSPKDISGVPRCETLATFLQAARGDSTLRFERVNFNDPFIIVFSSGTTGMPKCIVHSAGGVLVTVMKEANLHRGARSIPAEDSCTLQYTTTGWIMYLASSMSHVNGSRIILYDGSPFQPDLTSFMKLVTDQRVTELGISPRYLQTLATAGIVPKKLTDLTHLRRVISTGMILSEAQFNWFYTAFPAHVQLANISGGTDIAACFVMDTNMKSLYCGGTMTAALGMKVEVYNQADESAQGTALPPGEAGELVCTKAFPTMPVKFWMDESGEQYFDAYFARFNNVWTHGDFVSVHPTTRQIYLYGRADGVLNPSGVRFGSAEIYNILDSQFPNLIQDSIAVGRRRPQDMDEDVMLFLLMKPGKAFTEDAVRRVKKAIADGLGPRYVPRFVFETPEIPTTINLKKVELPVKQIVSGKTITPSDTLANKKCLDFYYQFAKVEADAVLPQIQSKL